MNTQTRIEMIDVWTEKPISKGEIAIAVDLFRRYNIDRPEQLICGIDAYRDLYKELDMSRSTTLDTYMGLRIKTEPELLPKEWRVRKATSKTYELKERSEA